MYINMCMIRARKGLHLEVHLFDMGERAFKHRVQTAIYA